MTEEGIFAPVVAPMLRNRRFMLAVTTAAALQIGLSCLNLPGWQCPVLGFFGIPCPGCGLTRASVLLLKGDWRHSIAYHAFAPVFILALVLVAVTTISPQILREKIIVVIDLIERRTWITQIILVALIIYWFARLAIMQSAFVKLVQN